MYSVTRGAVRDLPLKSNMHRQGWWWHCSGSPTGWDYGYAPEGPFKTKTYATRHLNNTMRLSRIAKNTGRWPVMPNANVGWAKSWAGQRGKPRMKPLKGTVLFGVKYRNYVKENTL